MLAAIVTDRNAGVDPLSLVVGYKRTLLLAALYDPVSGLALWPLGGAPRIGVGRTPLIAVGSDYQESKNLDQAGANILPNTAFQSLRLRAVAGPTVTWLLPKALGCASKRAGLFVAAGSSRGVRSVQFFDGRRRVSRQRRGIEGLYAAQWKTGKAHRGRHLLRAVVTDRRGARATALRVVRVCRR
jgi:hypothetical protein